MTEKPTEQWSPTVELRELERRVGAILVERVKALPAEEWERIKAGRDRVDAQDLPQTFAMPEGNGWTRYEIRVDDGGPPIDLGRVNVGAFSRVEQSPS